MDESGNWLKPALATLGWRDGWWTPPRRNLTGVVRSSWLKRSSTSQGKPWLPELVKGFEAIAYSSVVEVIPIHTVIQGREAGGQVNQ